MSPRPKQTCAVSKLEALCCIQNVDAVEPRCGNIELLQFIQYLLPEQTLRENYNVMKQQILVYFTLLLTFRFKSYAINK